MVLHVYVDGQPLKRYKVSANNPMEFLKVGCKVQAKLLDWPESDDEDDYEVEPEENGAVVGALPGANDNLPIDREPLSWSTVKENLIPDYVDQVAFSVKGVELVRKQEELKSRFPGVHLRQSVPDPVEYIPLEKPRGVVTASFDLDPAELERDPNLRKGLNNLYPWARFQVRPENIAPTTPSTQTNASILGPAQFNGRERSVQTPDKPKTSHAPRKLSLAERITKMNETEIDSNTKCGGIPTAEHEVKQRQASKSGAGVHSLRADSDAIEHESTSLHDIPADASVSSIAAKLGLQIRDPHAVQSMYDTWLKKGTVPGQFRAALGDYYGNLSELYIIANYLDEHRLKEMIVKKWQEADYKTRAALPDMSDVIRIFQFAPNTELCNWIAIVFSSVWKTTETASYRDFRDELDNDIDAEAIAKFLFDVTYERCPYVKGDDLNILPRWCDVHSHVRGGATERRCHEFRDRISDNLLASMQKKQADQAMEEAKQLLATHEGHGAMEGRRFPQVAKRKAVESLSKGSPEKKARRSGGR